MRWKILALAGFGTVTETTYVVAAASTITLSHSSGPDSITLALPAGAVADPTRPILDEISAPTYALPSGKQFAGRAFRMEGYRNNQRLTDSAAGDGELFPVAWVGVQSVRCTGHRCPFDSTIG